MKRKIAKIEVAPPPHGCEWEFKESLVKGHTGDFLLATRGPDRVWLTERVGKQLRQREIETPDPRALFLRETILYIGRKAAEGVGAEVKRSWPATWQAPWPTKASRQAPFDPPKGVPAAFAKQWTQLLSSAGRDADRLSTIKAKKVWRPKAAYTLIDGDLVIDGNVIVATDAHDYGGLFVRGSIRCRNLRIGSGFALLCGGDVTCEEALLASAADSVCYIAGKVRADLIYSGDDAWLSVFDGKQLAARHVSHYVMVGSKPVRPKRRADLQKILAARALDDREWKAMNAKEKSGEDPSDYIRLDLAGARRLLDAGKSILRSTERT